MFFLETTEHIIVDDFGEPLAWLIILPIMGLPIYAGTTLTTTVWLRKYGTNGIGYPILVYIFVVHIYTFKFLGRLIPFCTNVLLVSIFVAFIVSAAIFLFLQILKQ
jgi:hypothetical protein